MAALPELYRFLRINYFSRLPKKDISGDQKVFISLTTTPDRIYKITPTLISLLDQTVNATKVILNIPTVSRKGETYEIPPEIEKDSNIYVNHVKQDFGPATKFIPTLSLEFIGESDLIIVLDDDQIYPRKMVEVYLEFNQRYTDYALTMCGWEVPDSRKHSDRDVLHGAGLKIKSPHSNIPAPTIVDIIQGVSSYTIQKRFFDTTISDFTDAPEGALSADDIWISGYLSKRKIPKIVITPKKVSYVRLQSIQHIRTEGLRDTDNADNQNNDKLYNYFDWD